MNNVMTDESVNPTETNEKKNKSMIDLSILGRKILSMVFMNIYFRNSRKNQQIMNLPLMI